MFVAASEYSLIYQQSWTWPVSMMPPSIVLYHYWILSLLDWSSITSTVSFACSSQTVTRSTLETVRWRQQSELLRGLSWLFDLPWETFRSRLSTFFSGSLRLWKRRSMISSSVSIFEYQTLYFRRAWACSVGSFCLQGQFWVICWLEGSSGPQTATWQIYRFCFSDWTFYFPFFNSWMSSYCSIRWDSSSSYWQVSHVAQLTSLVRDWARKHYHRCALAQSMAGHEHASLSVVCELVPRLVTLPWSSV